MKKLSVKELRVDLDIMIERNIRLKQDYHTILNTLTSLDRSADNLIALTSLNNTVAVDPDVSEHTKMYLENLLNQGFGKVLYAMSDLIKLHKGTS